MDMAAGIESALEALRSIGAEFVFLCHPEADTMEKCMGIGLGYGARHCKNLFLKNKRGTDFRLLLMDPDKPYRTSEVSRALGVTRMSFGTEEELFNVLGLKQGSVSVMALANPCAREAIGNGSLHVVVDSSLLEWERICVHPYTSLATLVVKTADLVRFIESTGVDLAVIPV
ncbi:MAG: prolyl-tRNA synthetase associated domain-containing protein [Clostridia bacterium]|nr:prolyl-tRNA synthetase associated domain-containing protein [Clostridia bacterium]